MKRSLLAFCLVACLAFAGCSTTPAASADPGQQLLNTTADSCKANVAAIKAFNAAATAGAIKGDAARNGLKALEATNASCNAALAAFQSATTGAPK